MMLGIFDNLFPQNSIYTIYDYLDNKINNPCDEILSIKIYNFTPIIYNGVKFLITTLLGLEHLFLDKNNKIIIKYFLDENTFGDIVLNKHLNLLKIKKFNSDILSEFDSFYDEHTQLLFIKFKDICIEYFDISSYNLTRLMNTSFIKEKIIISNIDYYLNKLTINSEIATNYIYKQKYFTLPSLPYLYTITDSTMPLIGSPVINYNNELIGIVNLINIGNKIMITPIISIIRSLKYLESNNLLITNFDYTIETLNISNLKDESNLKNVLKIKNLISKNFRINDQDLFITSINDYLIADDGTIIYNNNNIPLCTYIWLNMFNKININYLKYKNKELITKTKMIYLKKWEKISNILISKLIYFNTSKTFIFELNEKILSIITDYLVKNNYKNILQKIYDSRFSIKRKKILLFLKLNKNGFHYFELIEDYNSIADINEKLNISKELDIKLSKYSIKLVKN